MKLQRPLGREPLLYLMALALLGVLSWMSGTHLDTAWQRTGHLNFCAGFLMLVAYVLSHLFRRAGLPLISGYIAAGILLGPHAAGVLSKLTVERLGFIDDLALSFIALSAGGMLQLRALRRRAGAIGLNLTLQAVVMFGCVFGFVMVSGNRFSFTRHLSPEGIAALAILLGVLAVARSPSSAIAIISECRARGPFTETVLSVTVAMDVLIIVLFTLALSGVRLLLGETLGGGGSAYAAVWGEIGGSLLAGFLLGRGLGAYILRVGHEVPLVLLFVAFGVTKASLWLDHWMQGAFGFSLHLEPLLICMSAGFTVRNATGAGSVFMEELERFSLPIFVLFFSIAGASLDMGALRSTWPLALCLVVIRTAGIFGATWLSGVLLKERPVVRRTGWMAYLTQAGVAIGLAQLAARQFPAFGEYLNTVVLAVISVNQVAGPIAFKFALERTREAFRQ